MTNEQMMQSILVRTLEIRTVMKAQKTFKMSETHKIKTFLNQRYLNPNRYRYYMTLRINPDDPIVITSKEKDVFLLDFTDAPKMQFKKIGTHTYPTGFEFQEVLNGKMKAMETKLNEKEERL